MKIKKYDKESIGISWEIVFFTEDGIYDNYYFQDEPTLEEIAKLGIARNFYHFEKIKVTQEIERYSIEGEIND